MKENPKISKTKEISFVLWSNLSHVMKWGELISAQRNKRKSSSLSGDFAFHGSFSKTAATVQIFDKNIS